MPNMSHSMQNLVKFWTKENLYIVSPAKILFEFLLFKCVAISSIQFSYSVVSDSLQPHGLQHVKLPRLPPTPRVYSNSCPSSQWCHPTISSSVPFSHLQSFPASGSFQMSQFFASGGQSIGVSANLIQCRVSQLWLCWNFGLYNFCCLRVYSFSLSDLKS